MEIILYGLIFLLVVFPFNVLPILIALNYLLGYEKYFLKNGFRIVEVVTVCF